MRCLRPARAEQNVDIISGGGRTLCVSLAVGTTLRANRVPQRSSRRREGWNGSRKLGRSCHKLQTISELMELLRACWGHWCLIVDQGLPLQRRVGGEHGQELARFLRNGW